MGHGSRRQQDRTLATTGGGITPPHLVRDKSLIDSVQQDRERHQDRWIKRFGRPERKIRRTFDDSVADQNWLAAAQCRLVEEVFFKVLGPCETGGKKVVDAVRDARNTVNARLRDHGS